MSASQLLDRIEQTGIVDKKTIARLRKEVENSAKSLKAKAVAKYLVDKGLMTQAEVDRLVESLPAEGKSQNTDDLLLLPGKPATPTPAGKGRADATVAVDPDATRVFGVDEVVDLVDADEVVEVPVEVQSPIRANDPLFSPPSPGASEGLFGETVASERPQRSSGGSSFKGKVDSSNQWQTKWLFIAFGLLSILALVGSVLYLSLSGESADNLLKMAEDSFNQGTYLDAATKYEELYKKFPSNEKADYARVKTVQSLLAEAHKGKKFSEVLTIASPPPPSPEATQDPSKPKPKSILEEVLDLKEFDEIRQDVALMLANSLLAESETALKKQTNAEMAQATTKLEGYVSEFVDRDVYIPGNIKKTPAIATQLEKLNNNIKLLRGSIKKEEDYAKALVEIKGLSDKSETDKAFEVFNTLVRTYGDMGARADLRTLMKEVSTKEIGLVKPADLEVAAQAPNVSSAIAQQVLLYCTSKDRFEEKKVEPAPGTEAAPPAETEIRALVDDVLPVLAEGAVFGVNAGNGTILWRQFVGYETTHQPQWTDRIQKKNMLLCDQRDHSLLCVDGQNGSVIWRSVVGQPFMQPTVVDGAIYLATRSGAVVRIDPYTGNKMAATQLPKKLLAPLEKAEGVPYIYVVAEDANLYVLSAEDLTCAEVFYIGHFPGSVTTAPLYWSGYLLVPVNGSDYCELHVLKFAEKGLRAERAQVFRLSDGPISLPPSRLGRWMLFLADNGEVKILELNTTEGEAPIRLVAEDKFENRGRDRFYMLAEGSSLWIASKGLVRYGIQRTLGKFERENIVNPGDYFLAPLARIDSTLFHLRRRDGSRQVSVSAVDAQTLAEIWRTDFGAAAPAEPIVAGNELAIVSAQGDAFLVDQAAFEANAVRNPLKASAIDQALNFVERIELDGQRHAFVAPAGSSDVLIFDLEKRRSQVSRMQAPADKPATIPVGLGPDLLVPTTKGQVVRIDPNNGRIVGTPFLPTLKPGVEVAWNRPAHLGSGKVLLGDHQKTLYLLDGSDRKVLREVGRTEVDGELVSSIAGKDSSAFVVADVAGNQKLLRLEVNDKVEVGGTTKLDGQVVAGPWLVGENLFLLLDDGQLHVFNLQGESLWKLDVANQQVAGISAREGGWDIALVSGRIVRVDAAGAIQKTIEIGQPIRLAPVQAMGRVIVCAADGTLLVLNPDQL